MTSPTPADGSAHAALRLCVAPDPNDPKPLVLFHGRCPDGFAAALAAWLYYQGQAEFVALEHGQIKTLDDLPCVAGRAVYVLDFSFPLPILQGLDARAAKLVLLDHHLSAAEKLSGFQSRCGVVHFDMEKSGARLAWEFFHPQQALPDLVRYVEDRDIWVWRYPQSHGFLAALDMEPMDFARWQTIACMTPDELRPFIARGAAMDAKFKQLAAEIAEHARALTFNGIAGVMVNAPGVFHSLVGNLLSEKNGSFALMWTLDRNGMVKIGLRSQSGFSCIALAERLGGGGHAQACGCKMRVERLPELLSGTFVA
jgi:hypothetical protein